MRALSIRQPWAYSIVRGTKRIENRSWAPSFRGQFLIHAAAGLTRDELEGWGDLIRAENISWPGLRGRQWFESDFDRGGIVGSARLIDVVEGESALAQLGLADQRPWFFGPKGLVLADVRPIELIPCRGSLGFWTVPPEIEAIVRQRLAA